MEIMGNPIPLICHSWHRCLFMCALTMILHVLTVYRYSFMCVLTMILHVLAVCPNYEDTVCIDGNMGHINVQLQYMYQLIK